MHLQHACMHTYSHTHTHTHTPHHAAEVGLALDGAVQRHVAHDDVLLRLERAGLRRERERRFQRPAKDR